MKEKTQCFKSPGMREKTFMRNLVEREKCLTIDSDTNQSEFLFVIWVLYKDISDVTFGTLKLTIKKIMRTIISERIASFFGHVVRSNAF